MGLIVIYGDLVVVSILGFKLQPKFHEHNEQKSRYGTLIVI
jgi:hypothetical protein